VVTWGQALFLGGCFLFGCGMLFVVGIFGLGIWKSIHDENIALMYVDSVIQRIGLKVDLHMNGLGDTDMAKELESLDGEEGEKASIVRLVPKKPEET
jgi:hypothetical protein